ncbi:MAG: permease [Nitrospirales bacterium]|nr:MAG: permease [Nitrospirales bacterium]
MYAVFKAILLLVHEHLRARPVRTGLTILGVAIGVSAWLAIRLVNGEVFRSFEASVQTVVGEASIQISGQDGEFNERLLRRIRAHPALLSAHPVLKVSASVQTGDALAQEIQILGVDLLELMSMDGLNVSKGQEVKRAESNLEVLLSLDSLFVGDGLGKKMGWDVGDRLEVSAGERTVQFQIRGFIVPSSPARRQLAHMAVLDIATAQSVFGHEGRLTHVNLVLSKDADVSSVLEELKAMLPSHMTLTRTSRRTQQVDAMVKVFQFNLTMLSTVGLLVGLFLVYNAMSFSVVQHRREIGILRAIGMSRKQISLVFAFESMVVGIFGGLIGCGLGFIMAQVLSSLVRQSVTDLYGVVTVDVEALSFPMIVEGGGLGVVVALIGALRPCWEASGTMPVRALAPGDYEEVTTRHGSFWAWMALGFFVMAGTFSSFQPVHGVPLFGYAAVFLLLLGCTLLGPLFIRSIQVFKRTSLSSEWSTSSLLAAEQLVRNPGRSSVTLSALVIGLAIMVGVGAMIQSFRYTVELWIDQTMMADVIVAPTLWWEGNDRDKEAAALSSELLREVRNIPGVTAIDPYREVQALAEGVQVVLVSRDIGLHVERSKYLFESGDSDSILHRMIDQRGVIISEVLGERLGVQQGDVMTIATPQGLKEFLVLGRFFDYSTDGGKVVMDQRVYQELWLDREASVFAVYLESGTELALARSRIEARLGLTQPITTISNAELRAEILDIFDRTFRVTYVLELIALCVAVLGIVNTLITAILERQRELATLRALGASSTQIQQLVFWESGYLSVLGAFLGVVGGLALSVLLVKVINKQSFGWTIQLMIPSLTIVEAVCIAAVAGLLAGYIPARLASKQTIAEGLRYE